MNKNERFSLRESSAGIVEETTMLKWTRKTIIVAMLAIMYGLIFHQIYPLVEISGKLVSIFVICALATNMSFIFALDKYKTIRARRKSIEN